MAKHIIEELLDDIDGSKAESTTTFSLDGSVYEIDLSKANKTLFLKELKPYIEHARVVKKPRKSPTPRHAPAAEKRTDLAAIREWAILNGHKVSSRGRVPETVVTAYDLVH